MGDPVEDVEAVLERMLAEVPERARRAVEGELRARLRDRLVPRRELSAEERAGLRAEHAEQEARERAELARLGSGDGVGAAVGRVRWMQF